MIVLHSRSATIPSATVRFMTWSEFSHVAVLTPSGTVLEAVFPRVREVPLIQYLAEQGETWAVDRPCADPVAALAWGRSQIGKRYDLLALVGVAVHRDWHRDDRWFCSEFMAAMFEKGGSPLFRAGALDHVFPQHSWLLHGPAALVPKGSVRFPVMA